ncbi:MAG TPA: PAS domain-containing protein, partial [Victivallales bacterium]|nr:PAS domain-containing protein [Victivallales bacterium]
GKKCYKYFHDREDVCPWCQNNIVFKGKTVRWEWFSDKTQNHYDLFDLHFTTEDGTVYKFEIFVDITDSKLTSKQLSSYRKDLEINLIERVNELNSISDSEKNQIKSLAKFPVENPHPVFRVSKQGKILYSNEPANLIQVKFLNETGSNIDEDFKNAINSALNYNKTMSIEKKIHGKIYIFFIIPVVNSDYLNIYGFDITAQKDVKNKLQNKNDRLNSLINNIPEVFYSAKADETGAILYISDRWEEWTGYSPDECYKNANIWPKSIHPDDLNNALTHYKNAIINKKNNVSEYRLIHKDTGKIRYVYDHGTPIADKDGKIFRYDGIVADITSYKKLEKEALDVQKMEAISTLTRGLGHEFNNIIGIIAGFTELLQDKNIISQERDKYLDQILRQTERAEKLVKNLSVFGSNKECDYKPLNLNPIINESINMIRVMLPANIVLEENINNNCSSILGSSNQIQQIIINICNNSSHSMKDNGGILKIDLYEVKNTDNSIFDKNITSFIVLCIKDNGCGISDENLRKIFTPFYTSKKVGEGSGLGLSVVHSIVTSHKGKITVDSKIGVGTAVNIYFPIIEFEKKSDSQGKITKSGVKGIEHILLVEDELSLAKVFILSLTRLGYKVTHVKNGKEALTAIEQQPKSFNLIFTDHIMPVMTGLELSKKLAESKYKIPIILTTGDSGLISKDEMHGYGISEILAKPVKIFTLTKLIQRLTREKQDEKNSNC